MQTPTNSYSEYPPGSSRQNTRWPSDRTPSTYRIGLAPVHPLTGLRIALQTGNWREISFGQAQNISDAAILGGFYQTVSAALAVHAFHISVFRQGRNDLLQIFQRNTLPVGNLVCAYFAFKAEKLKKMFLNLPLITVSWSALIAMMVIGTGLISFRTMMFSLLIKANSLMHRVSQVVIS